MSTPSFDRLLSVGQIANLLSLSTRSVRRLLPEIGFVRVGGTIRVPEATLERFLSDRFQQALGGKSRSYCHQSAGGGVAYIVDSVIGKSKRKRRG